jgi:uncharacterized protein YoaH (UPF0181 family)
MMWWSRSWRRNKLEQDLDRELQFHIDERISELKSAGMSEGEARRRVRQEFGGIEQVKEECRDARGTLWLESTIQDLRYALRTLRRSPVFTAVAVLTLGLGIGANTAIFSLINAVMLRMLPVQHPEQLVLLTDPSESGVAVDTTEHGIRSLLSYPEFAELRSNNTVFSGMLAAQSEVSDSDVFPVGSTAGQGTKARTELVSGNFFHVLGVQPIIGRVFTAEGSPASCMELPPQTPRRWRRPSSLFSLPLSWRGMCLPIVHRVSIRWFHSDRSDWYLLLGPRVF